MKNFLMILLTLLVVASAFLTGGLIKLGIVCFYMFLGWSLATMK